MRWKKRANRVVDGYKGKCCVCTLFPTPGGYDVEFWLPEMENSTKPNSLREAKKFAEDQVGTWFRNCGYWPKVIK